MKKIKLLFESLPEPTVLFDELSKIKLENINKYWLSNGLQLPKNNDEDRKIADIYRLLLITFSPEGSLPSMYRNATRLRTSKELLESRKSGKQYDDKGTLTLTCEISQLPKEYYKIILEKNCINKVILMPSSFERHFTTGNLSSLFGVKEIFVDSNHSQQLSEIPENIGDLTNLESLDLSFNNITLIPDSLYKLKCLKYLNLSRNKLQRVPAFISKMKFLKDIVVYANPFKELDDNLAFKTYPYNHQYNKDKEEYEPIVYTENILVINSSWLEIPIARIIEITRFNKVDTLRVESSEMLDKLLNSGSLKDFSHIKCLDLSYSEWLRKDKYDGYSISYHWYNEQSKIKEISDEIKHFQSLEELNLKSNRLESFPSEILELKNLKKLNLSSNSFTELPDLSNLSDLELLDFSSNSLSEIPESIFSLIKLKTLDLGFNHNIKTISDKIHQLQHLESLSINENDIECLPTELGKLKNLLSLNVSGNPLKNHLEIITKLPKLKKLDISSNRNVDESINIPNSLADLKSLNYLDISGCKILDIPASIGELTNLEFLNIENSEVESIDPAIGNLSKMITLNLAKNRNLKSVPETIGNLEKLENLNLYGCKNISEISAAFGDLKNLKQLSLDETQISNIDFVYEMTQLVSLELYDTKVNELSAKIKQLSELETLDIRSTSISSLPNEIGALHKLKEIQFSTFKKPYPDSLCNLTALETLVGSFEGVKKPYPEEFGNLTNLSRLTASHDVEPHIPTSFSKLLKLSRFSFRNSQFDKIPDVLFDLKNIIVFDFWGNNISEIAPEFLAKINQTNAINLYLDDNPASYSASKINKYKALLPSLYISG